MELEVPLGKEEEFSETEDELEVGISWDEGALEEIVHDVMDAAALRDALDDDIDAGIAEELVDRGEIVLLGNVLDGVKKLAVDVELAEAKDVPDIGIDVAGVEDVLRIDIELKGVETMMDEGVEPAAAEYVLDVGVEVAGLGPALEENVKVAAADEVLAGVELPGVEDELADAEVCGTAISTFMLRY